MLLNKLSGMKHRTPCRQLFCPFIQPRPLGGIKYQNTFFWRWSCCISILKKERSVEHYASTKFDLVHTPDLLGWVKRSDIETVQISIFWLTLATWYALVMIWVIPKMNLSVGEMDLMFCGKHLSSWQGIRWAIQGPRTLLFTTINS